MDPNVLVGFDTCDDAGVYLINDDQALVFTADLITPPVDDPYLFGQIAAANSLSDIYAMGGKPLSCLNLLGFPSEKLDNDILKRVLAGALSKITESGAVLLGGHTSNDEEPKFGLAVTGLVHPKKLWRNTGAKPGDQLILTKPLGSGVILNANKKKLISEKALNECLESLLELNKKSAEVLDNFEIKAVTDITGFGFAGHAIEMVGESKITFNIKFDEIPIFNEAREMYERGVTTSVNMNNRRQVKNNWIFSNQKKSMQEELVLDPQTNGGLLVAVPESKSKIILNALHDSGLVKATRIGFVSKFNKAKLCFF